jgi:hypothetical protein
MFKKHRRLKEEGAKLLNAGYLHRQTESSQASSRQQSSSQQQQQQYAAQDSDASDDGTLQERTR